MLTGSELASAIRRAMLAKGVGPTELARHFKIRQASVQGWMKTGRIGKDKIDGLIAYFSDVVGPGHWGLVGAAAQQMSVSREPLSLYSVSPEVQSEFLELLDRMVPVQHEKLLAEMRALVAVNEAVRAQHPDKKLRITPDERIEATFGIARGSRSKAT